MRLVSRNRPHKLFNIFIFIFNDDVNDLCTYSYFMTSLEKEVSRKPLKVTLCYILL